jgi:hypothetical protein
MSLRNFSIQLQDHTVELLTSAVEVPAPVIVRGLCALYVQFCVQKCHAVVR